MPGIYPTDAVLLRMLELGIEDMRKNPFLIHHMMEDFTLSPYLKDKYGKKQVDACKEWLENNQIDIYLRPRVDHDRLPCITIELGSSTEKSEMRLMGDLTPYTIKLFPNEIGKPIKYVVKPFSPVGYESTTGNLEVPISTDLSSVSAGMILVNPENGLGYNILNISTNSIILEPNLEINATQLGVLPQYQFYEARIEHTYFEESHNIRCHAHGDIQNTLWLWSICKYTILRYRQSLLEANGFMQSVVTSGSPELNEEWSTPGGERAYTRGMTLTGQIENTWIKMPHRLIETVNLQQETNECTFTNGIEIISNLNSVPQFATDAVWTTVEDE